MDVLIIEDELPARAKLIDMLKVLDPSIRVVAQLGSVKETVVWLRQNKEPHLAFVDIQLSDDHSFEIFRLQQVNFPVIFTTAFDKYMMESFEFNSIDYLLKPITEDKLKRSLEKSKEAGNNIFFWGIFKKLLSNNPPLPTEELLREREQSSWHLITMRSPISSVNIKSFSYVTSPDAK